MKLVVDPRKQRQMPENGPWIFWRRRSPDGPRLGLLVATFACATPGCDCREVKVEARTVDDSLRRAELANTQLVLEFEGNSGPGADGTEVLRAALDIDSGEVLPEDKGWNPDLARWLQGEIDGEVLDRLHAGWLATKRLPGADTRSTGPIVANLPGDMVPWQEVFPMARQDVYVTPEGAFEVLDSHCIEAGCRCKHSAVQILRGDELVANVLYDYTHARIVSKDRISLAEDVLDRVWSRYSRRYPVASRLAAHSAQVKAQAAEVRRAASRRSTVRQAAKVGRNEPCPCGSGKKYKRCCLKR